MKTTNSFYFRKSDQVISQKLASVKQGCPLENILKNAYRLHSRVPCLQAAVRGCLNELETPQSDMKK